MILGISIFAGVCKACRSGSYFYGFITFGIVYAVLFAVRLFLF